MRLADAHAAIPREHEARALALLEGPGEDGARHSAGPNVRDQKSARVMGSGAGVPTYANGVEGRAEDT